MNSSSISLNLTIEYCVATPGTSATRKVLVDPSLISVVAEFGSVVALALTCRALREVVKNAQPLRVLNAAESLKYVLKPASREKVKKMLGVPNQLGLKLVLWRHGDWKLLDKDDDFYSVVSDIKSLTLLGCSGDADNLFCGLRPWHNLQFLEIKVDSGRLELVENNIPHLKELKIYADLVSLSGPALNKLEKLTVVCYGDLDINAWGVFEKITYLEMSAWDILNFNGRNFPALEEFHLRSSADWEECSVPREDLKSLRSCPRLDKIFFDRRFFSEIPNLFVSQVQISQVLYDYGVFFAVEIATKFPCVEWLNLDIIITSLEGFTGRCLKRLSINSTEIAKLDFLQQGFEGLEKLDIARCPIESFEVLMRVPKLKHVTLSHSQYEAFVRDTPRRTFSYCFID